MDTNTNEIFNSLHREKAYVIQCIDTELHENEDHYFEVISLDEKFLELSDGAGNKANIACEIIIIAPKEKQNKIMYTRLNLHGHNLIYDPNLGGKYPKYRVVES